jgi:hypothetical protein
MGAKGLVDTDAEKLDVTYDMSMDISGESVAEDQFRVIMADGKYYVKHADDDTWVPTDASEMGNVDFSKGYDNSKAIAAYYRYSTITKTADVDYEGEKLTKYTLTFGKEALNAVMSELIDGSQAPGEEGTSSAIADGQVQGVVTLYINAQNQVAGEEVSFTTTMWDEDSQQNITTEININAHYYDIGKDVVIEAPAV